MCLLAAVSNVVGGLSAALASTEAGALPRLSLRARSAPALLDVSASSSARAGAIAEVSNELGVYEAASAVQPIVVGAAPAPAPAPGPAGPTPVPLTVWAGYGRFFAKQYFDRWAHWSTNPMELMKVTTSPPCAESPAALAAEIAERGTLAEPPGALPPNPDPMKPPCARPALAGSQWAVVTEAPIESPCGGPAEEAEEDAKAPAPAGDAEAPAEPATFMLSSVQPVGPAPSDVDPLPAPGFGR